MIDRGIASVLLVVAFALFAMRLYQTWAYTVDDAWITLRCARNLVGGEGFVYNPGGPRVEAYTNHLLWIFQVAVLACGGTGIGETKILGALAGFATIAGSVMLAWRLIRSACESCRVPLTLAATAAAWLAANHMLSTGATSGLETDLFAALITWGFVLWMRPLAGAPPAPMRTMVGAGVLVGLAAWTRPEGMAWAIGIALCVTVACRKTTPRRLLITPVAIVAGMILALTLFRLIVYGVPFPNTYYAKIHGDPVSRILSGLTYLRDWLALNFGWAIMLPAIVGVFLASAGRRAAPVIAVLAVLGHLAVVAWEGGDWIPHLRLITPCMGIAAAASALGCATVLEKLPRRFSPQFAITFSMILLVLLPRAFRQENGRALSEVQTRVLGWIDGHRALGNWLGQWNTDFSKREGRPLTVAVEDIGLIGWHSHATIIDLAGLADPEWAHLNHSGEQDYPAGALVIERNPEAIILVSLSRPEPGRPLDIQWHTNRAIYRNADFRARYRERTAFVHKDFPGDGYFLHVFVRNDLFDDPPEPHPPAPRASPEWIERNRP